MNTKIMKLLCMVIILGTYTSKVKAKPNITWNTVDSITITGKILDTAILKMPNKETEVVVTVSKYPFTSILMQNTSHHTYKLSIGNNTNFKFVLPVLADRFYMYIYYIPSPRVSPFGSIDNVYILERGDKINCVLTTKMFTFSGKGSAKLNCQSELSRTMVNLKNWGKLYSAKQFDQLAVEENNLRDSCFKVQKGILKKYNQILGKDLNALMLANCYGMRYFTTLWNYRNQVDNIAFYKGFINSTGYKGIDANSKFNIDPNLLVQSPIFTDFLFEKIMMQSRKVENDYVESNTSSSHIKLVYELIVGNYKGVLRDKLLATFFIQWQTVPTTLTYLDQSLFIITDPFYKNILIQIQEKNLKGRPFYPFELEDQYGKTVKLSDMNNKIILVDFWYTGCPGCAILKRGMEGVWETYKSNPRICFVSISIDKDKEQWKKSISTKIYTEPDAINLYTGGLGKSHVLIDSMGIASYPRMYLLKGGKLFSANLPWPSGADVTKGATKDFINIIETALKE